MSNLSKKYSTISFLAKGLYLIFVRKRLAVIICIFSIHLETASAKNICPEKEVCVAIDQRKLFFDIIAQNNTNHIVTVQIKVKASNTSINQKLRDGYVLRPKMKKKILTAKVKDKYKKSDVSLGYAWQYGSAEALHKDAESYFLPYQINRKYMVGQSFGGKESHNTESMRYAIDWNMPVGSRVYSARAGTVVEIEEKYEEGAADKKYMNKSNYVKILHDDGTYAIYAHLDKGGVLVKKGMELRARSFIAFSGNSGYSSGPHLHFHVAKPVITENGIEEQTIPFKFINCKMRSPFIPKVRKSYTSC